MIIYLDVDSLSNVGSVSEAMMDAHDPFLFFQQKNPSENFSKGFFHEVT